MKKIKKAGELILITLALLITYLGSNFILNRQLSSNEIRVRNFYKEKENTLDMLVLGSSSVYTSFSSPLAWNDFGYTSYVLATSGAPMGIMKSMLIEVQKHQKPKVIVIDMNGVVYSDKFENKEGSLRFWIDNMPSSKNKTETIDYLIPENERDTYRNPIKKYHTNWEKILACLHLSLIDIRTSVEKEYLSITGMSGSAKIANRKDKIIDVKNYKKTKDLYPLAKKHLYDLLEYLKENNIKNVVFVNTPRFYNKKMLPQKSLINKATEIIQGYGYEVLDLDNYLNEIHLDKNHDYYDNIHVNVYGQKKVTKFLSEKLNEKYNLKSNYDETTVKKWNKEYEAYQRVFKWVDKKIKEKDYVSFDIRKTEKIIY